MNKIKGFKIRLRKREILKNLKYSTEISYMSAETEQLIQKQLENAYSLIHPCVIYETYNNNDVYGFRAIKEELLFGSSQVKVIIKDAYAITIMAATIGSALEEKVNDLKCNDLNAAFILDAAGSEAAEQVINFVSKILQAESARQECVLSTRYSPGYGDWPLEASRKIISMLDHEKIDMKLSDSGILYPRKSITAIQTWRPQ
ncbi:hypothetical protein ACFLR5_01565 [Elusimicrobiota bacterium]